MDSLLSVLRSSTSSLMKTTKFKSYKLQRPSSHKFLIGGFTKSVNPSNKIKLDIVEIFQGKVCRKCPDLVSCPRSERERKLSRKHVGW